MAYLGNTSSQQAFSPAVDYFNGTGSATAFTLSRPVASVAQVQVIVENVPQNPSSAFTVSGSTITFTSAPPSGTSNVYVQYTSPITNIISIGQGTVNTTQLGSISTIPNGAATLTLPTSTDTLVGRATTDTLTNKTLTGAALNGTLGATTPSTVAGTTGIFSSQVRAVTTVSDHGIRVAAPSGDASGALLQFTSNSGSTQWVLLNGTANTLTVTASTGLVCSGNVTAYSDTRIKKNIIKIDTALEKVEQLNGYTFDRTDVSTNRQTGLLAQEVLKVLPEAVIGSEDTIYSVAYGNLMGLMVEAIKELRTEIRVIQSQIKLINNKKDIP